MALEISDHILDFTISGPYFLVSVAIALATSLALILGRNKKWWLGFAKTVNQASVWLVGAMAVIQAGPAKNLLPLPVSAILLFGDWLKTSDKLVEEKFRKRQANLPKPTGRANSLRRLRWKILDHPRHTISVGFFVLGFVFLLLTPIFSNLFQSTANERLVFAVAWLPVNNFPQSIQIDFDTVNNLLSIRFSPNGPMLSYPKGILYVVEPFPILGATGYTDGAWSHQSEPNSFSFPKPLSGLFGGGEQIILNYTNGPGGGSCSCQVTFNTVPMMRNDLNGISSMELPYQSLKGGAFGFANPECQQNDCLITGINMTTTVSIAVPHEASSLQTSPISSGGDFSQKYTSAKWDNLTSPVFLSYLSPSLLARYQFAILASGILVAQGVGVTADGLVKWMRKKGKRDKREREQSQQLTSWTVNVREPI